MIRPTDGLPPSHQPPPLAVKRALVSLIIPQGPAGAIRIRVLKASHKEDPIPHPTLKASLAPFETLPIISACMSHRAVKINMLSKPFINDVLARALRNCVVKSDLRAADSYGPEYPDVGPQKL